MSAHITALFYLAQALEGEFTSGEILLCPTIELCNELWTHYLLVVTNLTTTHEVTICCSQVESAVNFNGCLIVDRWIALHPGKTEMLSKQVHLLSIQLLAQELSGFPNHCWQILQGYSVSVSYPEKTIAVYPRKQMKQVKVGERQKKHL